MAPKKPLKTGGKAGAVPGRPGKPMAGLRDKTVRVPAAFNAQTVDPTNQRGAGQRVTGGLAGGRAGKPAGKIAGQTPKPAAAKPAAKPSGQFKAPSVPKPGTATKPQGTPQAQKWLRENTMEARVSRNMTARQIANINQVRQNLAPVASMLGGVRNAAINAITDVVKPRPLADSTLSAQAPKIAKQVASMKSSANKAAKSAASTSRFAGARDKAMAKAKGIKGSPVLGPKIVGPKKVGSGGGGTIAQAFDKSFASARKAGKSEFTFQGKRYNTKMK